MWRARKGVTLVELLMSLALFSILVLCTLPQLTFMHQMILRSELEHLYALCTYLRRKAIATGQEEVLVFDEKKNSYAYDDISYTLSKYVCFGYKKGVKGPPAEPHHALDSPITFVNKRIVFYPTGIIQSGTVYITDVKKQKMYAISVPVSQVSFVRIYRYDNKWVLI